MSRLVEVALRPGVSDAAGRSVQRKAREHLGIEPREVRVRQLFRIDAPLSEEQVRLVAEELLCDPVTQQYALDARQPAEGFDFSIIVAFRPGVTDNVGRTAAAAAGELLGRPFAEGEAVFTATQYLLEGVQRGEAERIARELLANDLIEAVSIQDRAEWELSGPRVPSAAVVSDHRPQVAEIDLELSDQALEAVSRQRTLALSLEEMRAIRDHFRRPDVREGRRAVGLGPRPTDVELEALAQTWSEHCHHKVFGGRIEYDDGSGVVRTVDSLFRSFIRRVTEELASPWLLSVFQDNAGVIRFNDRLALVYKVETHNSPSALDPYGGAMTGIVGVNRDPFGTGLGAELIANVWGYCLGDPFFAGKLPAGMLHPRRIREGVHRGVIEGGNQSGIPYARGWELFEERYMGKPLVFCGTLGSMPLSVGGIPSVEKRVLPGDVVVMVGGRVGKDGIHGATFSSEELHAGSPVQAVQIGDPITQKKMTDMLLEARDRRLYRTLTDNGAGGLSSSVGEMAQLCGGADIDLAAVPLKYHGLDPWEILVSEAQERMTLAVPEESLAAYLELSALRGVESTVLGRFTDTGALRVRYGERTVAFLDLEFLHHGDPPYRLQARFAPPRHEEPVLRIGDHAGALREMLARPNLCSIESKARQYDHEVQARAVLKPFAGARADVPSDAAVLLADYEGLEGVVLAEGVAPFYSDIDTYWMAASALDMALRRLVSVGADPDFVSGLDNFCWPNVVKPEMPERAHKLAQLVRACEGLYAHCKAFGVPLISGKDSMSNDSTLSDPPISVPPTLLVSVLGRIPDVRRAVSLDLKSPGDLVYVLGETRRELGGSELYRWYGQRERGRAYVGNAVPQVDAETARLRYRCLHRAMQAGLVRSCHTPALGGLAAALARAAFGGRLGAELDLGRVPTPAGAPPLDETELLYSESNSRFLVGVAPQAAAEFERLFVGQACRRVGRVLEEQVLRLRGLRGQLLLEQPLEPLLRAWKETLAHG